MDHSKDIIIKCLKTHITNEFQVHFDSLVSQAYAVLVACNSQWTLAPSKTEVQVEKDMKRDIIPILKDGKETKMEILECQSWSMQCVVNWLSTMYEHENILGSSTRMWSSSNNESKPTKLTCREMKRSETQFGPQLVGWCKELENILEYSDDDSISRVMATATYKSVMVGNSVLEYSRRFPEIQLTFKGFQLRHYVVFC